MNSDLRHRRSIRLKGYSYAGDGGYFITICTHERATLLGDVLDGTVLRTPLGDIAAVEWERTASLRRGVRLDEYVVMPNHLHGILVLDRAAKPSEVTPASVQAEGVAGKSPLRSPSATIGAIVRGFKAASTRQINVFRALPSGEPVWQRNYYEHIIRDHDDLDRIREYIITNPARWAEDAENVARGKHDERTRRRATST